MLAYLPFVPLSQGVRIGVAILSDNGHVRFAVTGDFDALAETEWFCNRIEAAVAELARCTDVVAAAPARLASAS
jgi:hypothetical protein